MEFPAWVEKSKSNKKRATSRLRFILSTITLQRTGQRGMRGLAPLVGLDYTTLYHYVREGAFSQSAADCIEKALGKKVIKASDLTNPLEITTAP